MDLLALIEELKAYVERLTKRKERLEKLLGRQGYSLKRINGNTYIYVWKYENGKARWWCLGNVKKVPLPLGGKGELIKELVAVGEELERVRSAVLSLLKDKDKEI